VEAVEVSVLSWGYPQIIQVIAYDRWENAWKSTFPVTFFSITGPTSVDVFTGQCHGSKLILQGIIPRVRTFTDIFFNFPICEQILHISPDSTQVGLA
jgi:hypothetical protein